MDAPVEIKLHGMPAFEVPADEIGRNMLDDGRFRAVVSGFDFSNETVSILGGSGFVGLHLAKLFTMCGKPPKEVRLADVAPPFGAAAIVPVDGHSVVFVQLDIASRADVDRAIAGASVVVQVASYGMSGREMLDLQRIRAVNVGGTQHVIDACKRHRVKALVYTSSVNAVFNGTPFREAGDDLPYPELSAFRDAYSRTKSEAERMVRAANGWTAGDGAHTLRTVALRMAGIYGVGERRHFPRIIRLTKLGIVKTIVGGLEARQDWVSIANACYAHVLAAHRLLQPSGVQRVAGAAFAITDRCPVNQYRMLEPLFNALGSPLPTTVLPLPVALAIATAMDTCLLALRPLVALEPLLTKAEVQKVAVEHYFGDRAARDLGYEPVMPFHEGIARTLAAFIATIDKSPPSTPVAAGTMAKLASNAHITSPAVGFVLIVALLVALALPLLWRFAVPNAQ